MLGMTVREMLLRIDSRELTEWQAYYGLNPWGPERADLRAGTIAATVANAMTESGGFKPSDFMPTYGPPPVEEPKTLAELRDQAVRFALMLGGTVNRK